MPSLLDSLASKNIDDQRNQQQSLLDRILMMSTAKAAAADAQEPLGLPGLFPPRPEPMSPLQQQLGLGNIQNPSLLGLILGSARQLPTEYRKEVMGEDPTTSPEGEALRKHGERRFQEEALKDAGLRQRRWRRIEQRE